MKISVVIAAYNEADNIGALTSRLVSTLSAMRDTTWELIYVIEGTDETLAIAETFAVQHQEISILYNREPSGLANAFRKGFRATAPDSVLVVTMDADLNHQPEEIPRLVEALVAHKADIVVGSRKVQGSTTTGTPFWKQVLSDSFNRTMRSLIGMPVADMTSGYRVYRTEIAASIAFDNSGFAFLPEILMRAHAAGLSIVEEPIQFIFRVAGGSKMKLIPTIMSYSKLLSARLMSMWTVAAVLIMAAATFIRVLLEYPVHKFAADSDAMLAGLCGIKVLQGSYPVFFPGGHRLGSQSCYLTAASFSLFGISRGSLAVTSILFFIGFISFTYLYLRKVFGPRASLAGIVLAAFPPLQVVANTYVAWAYGEILMYCASTLWLAAVVTQQVKRNTWFFALGLSAGLGFWCSAQSLMITLPIAIWLLLHRVVNSPERIVLTTAGLLAGSLPLWMFALLKGGSAILGEASLHAVNSLAQVSANTSYVMLQVIPSLLFDKQPSEIASHPAVEALMLVYVAGMLTVIGLMLWPKSSIGRSLLPQALLLGMIVLCCIGMYVLSGAGSIRGWTVRYILPIYLVVPGIAALIFSATANIWRLTSVVSIAFILGMNLSEYPFEGSSARRSMDDDLIEDKRFISWLTQRRIQAVVGGYWDVYSLNFDSRGMVIGVPLSDNDDYLRFGDQMGTRKLLWAIVDKAPEHLTEWEHQLHISGEMTAIGDGRIVFVPDTNPPADARMFLDLVRAASPH